MARARWGPGGLRAAAAAGRTAGERRVVSPLSRAIGGATTLPPSRDRSIEGGVRLPVLFPLPSPPSTRAPFSCQPRPLQEGNISSTHPSRSLPLPSESRAPLSCPPSAPIRPATHRLRRVVVVPRCLVHRGGGGVARRRSARATRGRGLARASWRRPRARPASRRPRDASSPSRARGSGGPTSTPSSPPSSLTSTRSAARRARRVE